MRHCRITFYGNGQTGQHWTGKQQMFRAAAAATAASRLCCPVSQRQIACRPNTCPCRQFFFEQYQQLDEELFSPNRAAFPADRFNYTSFAWAVASVRSKLHAPLDADPVALVPLADAVSAAWATSASGLFVDCIGHCM
jgi:hypothetical protein